MSLPQEQWSQLKLIQGSGSTGSIYQHPNGKKYRQLRNTKTQRTAEQYGGGAWTDTYEEVLEHHNQWSGWKTALKPAHEPIVMARKPYKGSTKDNVLQHGVGALNIDATRIVYEPADTPEANPQGRFPSNVLGDIPNYQKYFYCPKVSRRERHCGCEDIKASQYSDKKGNGIQRICETCGTTQMKAAECKCATKSWVMPMIQGNNHPTVKPVALMKYLIQLVTPANSTVLDPFMGSGTTGMAARELGHTFVGCEQDPRYVTIANRRIQGWLQKDTQFRTLFEEGTE